MYDFMRRQLTQSSVDTNCASPQPVEISFDPIADFMPRRPGSRVAEDGSLVQRRTNEAQREVKRFLNGRGKSNG